MMENQTIVILGAGESGTGAALLAKAKGYNVFVSDSGELKNIYRSQLQLSEIPFEEGGHSEAKIMLADEIIKSPGIPFSTSVVQKALAKGIPVIDEIEFAARYTKARIIAITGTNGKTTTTLLTYHILKTAGYNVGLAGNVGQSFARQLVKSTYDYVVLEISSFQIEGLKKFKPKSGCDDQYNPRPHGPLRERYDEIPGRKVWAAQKHVVSRCIHLQRRGSIY